jgi:predicted nucleotidyltransferase/predicted transcriptional regulator
MLTNNQHMLNNNQQSLDENQHLLNENRPVMNNSRTNEDLEKISENFPGKNMTFLNDYGALFRKSTLMLIITLGRDAVTKFHVRDLSRLLNYDVSLVSKNLKYLEQLGLVNREDVGNLVFYQADMNSALLKHMKICFTLLELNELIRNIRPGCKVSILYGSCAKGEDSNESDVDLFVETLEKEEIKEIISQFQKKMNRRISPLVVTPNEAYQLKANDEYFYSSIFEGIILNEE